jgi:hypothetical protein
MHAFRRARSLVKRRPTNRFAEPAVSFGDNVRVLPTPETETKGLAGQVGQIYGWTTPSITGVSVIGGVAADVAIRVQFAGRDEGFWFSPELLELIDHAPGTEMVVGNEKWVRNADGSWAEEPPD